MSDQWKAAVKLIEFRLSMKMQRDVSSTEKEMAQAK